MWCFMDLVAHYMRRMRASEGKSNGCSIEGCRIDARAVELGVNPNQSRGRSDPDSTYAFADGASLAVTPSSAD